MKSQQDKINANTLRDNLLSANVSAVDENYKGWREKFTIEQMFVLSEVCNDQILKEPTHKGFNA